MWKYFLSYKHQQYFERVKKMTFSQDALENLTIGLCHIAHAHHVLSSHC